VVVYVDLPGSEETLAKDARGSSRAKSARVSSPAKSLIRHGFLGLRVAPPTVSNDALSALTSPALPVVKGDSSLLDGVIDLGRSLCQPVASTLLSPSVNWGIFGG
jgi:hypothetical protein